MGESELSPGQALLKEIRERHFSTVRTYLEGGEVGSNSLWLSVGYFLEGFGHWGQPKPWRSEEELERLLKATKRSE